MFRILVPCVLLIGLAACETVEGFGRDVESGGRVVQDAAN